MRCSCFCFVRGQIFGEDMEEDYELGEALRGDITDNPLDIYMRVRQIPPVAERLDTGAPPEIGCEVRG